MLRGGKGLKGQKIEDCYVQKKTHAGIVCLALPFMSVNKCIYLVL